ncbi:flavin reductase family protein [Streptomyces aurantiacus]|uniref:Putative Flavin-dependent monooxygenase, reductase subunit HsaB n=1 Tax=Streptomyces aurantiacus JA 4570 TaxID=1286094 RepID=S4A3F8_9ACTN|nr:flavin reductase [Streptomyces aurantiacus]EPH45250.1 putative Flavin-dependent monooxygenase, reductase subunit HsaB [Streptomyces aurantiacus JA 4570]
MTDHETLPAEEVEPDEFRDMMSGFPSGVSVVTAIGQDGLPRGMTCSSVCSVSLAPPTLVACLRHGSPTLEAVLAGGRFALNLLHSRAESVAVLFASGDPRRFDMTPWHSGPTAGGPHLIRDAHSIADCTVTVTQRVGDHVAVFGRTRLITRHQQHSPLLYGLREFRPWAAT